MKRTIVWYNDYRGDKMNKFKLIIINSKYCDYLRQFDSKVPYNFSKKENRPFVGVLFKINNLEYFAPLSSPKPKHVKMKNNIDFYKIYDGKLGVVNFNNMIPVLKREYKVINFSNMTHNMDEIKYMYLLKNQLDYLNKYYIQITNKSFKFYNLYVEKKLNKKIIDRCCNFKLLEEKSLEYNKILV